MQTDIARGEDERARPVKAKPVLFYVHDRNDDWARPFSGDLLPSGPGTVAVVRARRPGTAEVSEHGWVVELDVDLRGPSLDPEDWLRHCHDFLVDSESGDAVGIVDQVEFAPGSSRVTALIVLSGRFGHRVLRIAPAEVQAIVPDERRLIVRGGDPRSGRGAH